MSLRPSLSVLAVAVALLALAAPAVAPAATLGTFRYTVESRGDVATSLRYFAAVADEALNDERGWSLRGGVLFRRVASGGDFRLVLASPAAVDRAAPGCSEVYSCTVGDAVLINDRRFRYGTSSWNRSLGEYQQYVITHEVGHWLGLGHEDCPGSGRSAPVMQQQSISLNGCRANPWPRPSEREAVAEVRGIRRGAGPSLGGGATTAAANGDFDGDGHDDLAVGVPGEGLGGRADAGAVSVTYGGPGGLDSRRSAMFHQGVGGITGANERGDEFGSAVAAGDFDGDGRADLAIGASGEGLGGRDSAGAVHVLYGSPDGLRTEGSAFFYQGGGLRGAYERFDRVGHALAAGDLDGDGHADLAIGAPQEGLGGRESAGAVNLLYGSPDGLTRSRREMVHQASRGVRGAAEPLDRFGLSVATGDLNADGRDDLAVGVPFEGLGSSHDAGMVNVLFGSPGGITAFANTVRHQADGRVAGAAEFGDRFGQAVAIGDSDGDGFGDLVAGVPGEGVGRIADAGMVNVFGGSRSGPSEGGRSVHQNSSGIPDAAELGDAFGAALSVADLDGDRFAAIVVGVPDEDLFGRQRAGMAMILRSVAVHAVHQGTSGVPGAPESGDGLAASVAVGDFDGDGQGDVAAGTPGEGLRGRRQAGAVTIVPGGVGGIAPERADMLHQASAGVPGAPESLDAFGAAVGASR